MLLEEQRPLVNVLYTLILLRGFWSTILKVSPGFFLHIAR